MHEDDFAGLTDLERALIMTRRFLLGLVIAVTAVTGLLIGASSQAQEASIEASGFVDIAWVAPTANTDGTPLTDLAGYRVYWGTASRSYTNSLPIDDAGLTSATLAIEMTQLQQTFFVAMTALDEDGNESDYSNEISRTVTIEIEDTMPPAPPTIIETSVQFTLEGCVVVSNPSATCTIRVE